MAVSVVLPCLNEEESVGLCVEEALAAFRDADLTGEVIVVDNGSTDRSAQRATEAGGRVVAESRPGYGRALRTGFDAARGDVVVMADADLTYDLSRVAELVEPVASGRADLVLASRLSTATRHTMPALHRFVGTPVLSFLTRRACGRRVVDDSQSGYRAFHRDLPETIGLSSTGMELASEMLIRSARADLRIEEIEIPYRARIGESKLSTWSDGMRHLRLIFLLAPDLLLIGPGITLLALGLVALISSFLRPLGVEVGSLVWQPVFFSGIALVLGVDALLAGSVLAYNSSVTTAATRRRFAFAGREDFSRKCFGVGVAMAIAGLVANAALFLLWLGHNGDTLRHFGLASLSQSLIISGATVAAFGVISSFIRARDRQESAATRHEDLDRTPTTADARTA